MLSDAVFRRKLFHHHLDGFVANFYYYYIICQVRNVFILNNIIIQNQSLVSQNYIYSNYLHFYKNLQLHEEHK